MAESIDTFATARLTAARRSAADYDDLRRLHQDPQAMATLSADGRPLAEELTRASLRSSLEHWERYGFGIWTFRDTLAGQFVGYCGLRRVVVESRDEVELLYALLPAYWGRGLATEMAQAVLALGFGRLGLADVVAYTLPTNRASRRVMEKAGFSYERDIVHAGLPHVLYRLTAAEWEGRASIGHFSIRPR
jgi:RimJ/RimL family protein N-acetyltransferase